MIDAYIALGSNIEPKVEYLERANLLLGANDAIQVIKTSSIYQTEPVGYTDQDVFLNQVVQIKTTLTPQELLKAIQNVEQELGRKRDIRWGPRTIDLDILLYNHDNIESENLIIPHPRMTERAFVLVPFNELAGDVLIGGKALTVKEALAKLPLSEVASVVRFG
ncbi:2-amino-4-hydroxy-6-hydroxymethyldihydropteridine diphosphokinase [Halolactibacillus alkaliphilus]|uniref:2-amino-4-hydroxy-6-hydroxymethyldihydropteridine diphosphokinase n=1 Tax=Halolactibacillus alkaliphilus TaxID=442899 RepID=A0A511X4S8_9BACI|nr:2-amino-4-hydroxy-6-hydroxymethyldihydropteridine diphosphokinase [Halolactibacillus alkaliphilus]GEN57948.1 2-amino-4-hydroxy-6-hydroxymethyldihydropteridine diphosphokinase [Halolactibacillus alkaliphilus]GGN75910.1 2-amino-4-hydroxy-6-hydroxymethyldihydropteridine diphosphokinase [Halolactibacillus alkaliphilus]SFP09296.1 2-amino-4-hydroxy-6-hydroxymethyldihydropteridinediphosphokinase [Halolactibacillus alkaliphilus]